jgi:hypothetical protein
VTAKHVAVKKYIVNLSDEERERNRGETPGTDAFFVCLGSEKSDSSYG